MLFGTTPSSSIMSNRQTIVGLLRIASSAVGLEAQHFAAIGDHPKPVPLDQRHGAHALLRIVEMQRSRHLFAGELPLEPAVALPEAEQAAQIDLGRVALEPAGAVVRGSKDRPPATTGVP